MNKPVYLILFVVITGITIIIPSCKQKSEAQKLTDVPMPKIEGDFISLPELTDEFDGAGLDTAKWHPVNPGWLGRQPAFFSKNNVAVEEGMLNLTMRKEEPPAALKDKGFHTYSSAAVQSRYSVKYGYFEIRSKAMRSHGSSAFWFYRGSENLWTEIDVFEICGTGERENQYNMNAHVFITPLKKEHWSKDGEWRAPYRFADDFHVFGLEWTPYVIRWYVDGEVVYTIENTHWHQALTLNFDSETMPDWFGLPDDNELPSTFSIDYVHAWKYKSAEWMDEGYLINKTE
jgi:beta-glucanase (GH16 family)